MELLVRLKKLAQEERRITLELLHLLREAEDTLLHAQSGYSSLFEFCVKELRYSEGAAYRRISAMRLLKEDEELGEKLLSGAISLSVASKAHQALRHSHFTKEEREQLFAELEGKSARQADTVLRPFLPKKESGAHRELQDLGNGRYHLSVYFDELVAQKLERLRSFWSHRQASRNFRLMLEEMMAIALAKHPLEAKSAPTKSVACDVTVRLRHIPAALKRKIWERDRGRCTYVHPETGKRCEAKFLLQYDHITPHALGGTTTEQNLRLLCRAHNLLLAEQAGLSRPPPPSAPLLATAPAPSNTSS